MNRSTTNSYPLLLETAGVSCPPASALRAETGRRDAVSQNGVASRLAGHSWRVAVLMDEGAGDGGSEMQPRQLTRALESRGWDVSLLSIVRGGNRAKRIAAGETPVRASENPLRHRRVAIWQIVRFLREAKPHIVHCYHSRALMAARLTRVVNRIPVLVETLPGSEVGNVAKGVRGLGRMGRAVIRRFSDVTTVVCSADAQRSVSGVSRRSARVRLIPSGVATDQFRPNQAMRERMRTELALAGEFVWLMAGGLHPVKDHHTALRAFARVATESPRSVLVIAGDGALRGELGELAAGLGLGSRVRFLGARSDMPALMNAADAFLLSSVSEALPVPLLEAAASGLPIVTTDVGGTPEIVMHGVNGMLTPASNSEALAAAMRRVGDLPEAARKRMGEHSRRHMTAKYALEQVVGQWESLYHELLTTKEVRP